MKLALAGLLLLACASVQAKNDLLGLDEDLACSAVKTVAEKIQKGYSKKYKKSDSDEQSDPDAREEMARSAFVSTCKASGFQNWAQVGNVGKRHYGDFNVIMSKGGNMENLSMGPQVAEELVKSCKTIIMEFGDEIASGYAAAEKQFDYKIAKELKAVLGVCGKKPKGGSKKKQAPAPPPPPSAEEEEEVVLHDDDDL